MPPSNHADRTTGIPEVWASSSRRVTSAQAGWVEMSISAHGIGASTSREPLSSSRAIIRAVRSLLTLATTIGESDVAGVPSIVVPQARLSTRRPSRTTVIVTAPPDASCSNAALAAGIAGSASGAIVVVVCVVVVVVVVVCGRRGRGSVVVVVVEVVDVDGAAVVAGGPVVEGGADSERAADVPAHPGAIRRMPVIRTTSRVCTTPR